MGGYAIIALDDNQQPASLVVTDPSGPIWGTDRIADIGDWVICDHQDVIRLVDNSRFVADFEAEETLR